MREEWKRVAILFGVWLTVGAILYLILPTGWKWISYLVLALPPAALLITGIIISLKRFGLFKPRAATIRGRTITACYLCPYREIQPNVVSKSFPIVKCEEKEMRINYTPDKVPRWCPYVPK